MQSVNEPARKGTCVVTFDVAGSLQAFRSRGMQVPEQNDPIFSRLRLSLIEKVARAFPNLEIVAIDKDDLRSEIRRTVKSRINGHSVLVTCSEMAALNPDPDGLSLSINRLFDADGKILGYGPRPGHEDLSKQFDNLTRKIAGRPVILAKEGAFKANTCCFILDELDRRGVCVVVHIMGFCDLAAKASIERKLHGQFVPIRLFDHLVEWIADRDMIPFMPGCGRVLGEVSTHSFMPVQTAEGFSCAFPYVLPFGRTEKWTSMEEGHASELSAHLLDFGIELFGRMEQMNGRAITAGELLGNNPRVSLPVYVAKTGRITGPNTQIVGFLEEVRKTLG